MNMFASSHEKQTVRVGLCVLLCIVCIWWGWLWPSGERKFWEVWGWARWRSQPAPRGLHALFTSTPVSLQSKRWSRPTELIPGGLPAASPTTPPSLATGLAMRSSAKDVSEGSQMGLAASIPEFDEVETVMELTSPFPIPRGSPRPSLVLCPLEKFQE